MRGTIRIITMTGIVACALAISALSTGCADGKDVATRALRAEADDLNDRLADTRRALGASEEQNAQLKTSNEQLLEQLAALERERKQELDKLQSLRDGDVAAANKRIRGLSAQIDALNRDIQEKNALNSQKDARLAEQTRSINQLNSSIDAHRKQLAALEREKTTIAKDLQAARKQRARVMLIAGFVCAGCFAVGFLTRRGRESQAPQPESTLRMPAAAGNRRVS